MLRGEIGAGAGGGLLEPGAEHGGLPDVRDGREHREEAGGNVLLGAENGAENRRRMPLRGLPQQRAVGGYAQHLQSLDPPRRLPRLRPLRLQLRP